MSDRLRERIVARITGPQTPDEFADVVATVVLAALAERRACFNPDHTQPAAALDVDEWDKEVAHHKAVAAIEAAARAALLAELAAGVEGLRSTFSQHTCWDNHEGGVDAEGNPTLHADGSTCGDRIIGESISRAAVLDLIRKAGEEVGRE